MVKIKTLHSCDFPLIEREAGNFKVLVIPPGLLKYFDDEGYQAVRIYSAEVASRLPHFGGGTAPGRSQVPHQDHNPHDKRRFLAFSKTDTKRRGSSTYLVDPERVRSMMDWLLEQFEMRREDIEREFVYRPPYMVSREELYRCFEPGGLTRVVTSGLGNDASADLTLYAYTGMLTYLLQDRFGDDVVEMILKEHRDNIWVEEWDTPGVLIIDNSRTFHGRRGPNVPLRRNWLLAS